MPGGSLNITGAEKENLLRRIHSGEVNIFKLDPGLYNKLTAEYSEALFKGYGLTFQDVSINTPDYVALQSLQKNLYVFSAAKEFQQIKDIQNLILDQRGFIRPFRKFEKDAAKIFDTYNSTWLKAEYATAKEGSRAARRWTEIQRTKSIFPFLKYQTREDSRVRPEHAELNGIVRPVEDPFWETHTPPNGWGCNNRCRLVKLRDVDEITKLDKNKDGTYTRPNDLGEDGKPIKTEPLPKLFNFNFGKEGVIFPERSRGLGIDSHPYFKVADRFDTFKRNNFNMPIPSRLVKPPVKTATVKARPTPAERLKEVKAGIKSIIPIQDRIKGNQTRVTALNNELKELEKQRKRAVKNRDTLKEVETIDLYNEKVREINPLILEIRKIRKEYEDEITNLLAQGKAGEFKYTATAKAKKIPRLRAGVEAFKRITGDRLGIQGRSVSANISQKKKKRAYYDQDKVYYNNKEDIGTITHELGHWLEDKDANYFEKVKAFYARRTAKDKIKRLRDITGNKNYKPYEVTKEDDFISPYTGRLYQRGIANPEQYATELTSMWFTEVYRDLHGFIKKDRDHFETIFKLLNE